MIFHFKANESTSLVSHIQTTPKSTSAGDRKVVSLITRSIELMKLLGENYEFVSEKWKFLLGKIKIWSGFIWLQLVEWHSMLLLELFSLFRNFWFSVFINEQTYGTCLLYMGNLRLFFIYLQLGTIIFCRFAYWKISHQWNLNALSL